MKSFLSQIAARLHPTSIIPTETQKFYQLALTKTTKLWTNILECTTRIGQLQLLKRQISNHLNVSNSFLLIF